VKACLKVIADVEKVLGLIVGVEEGESTGIGGLRSDFVGQDRRTVEKGGGSFFKKISRIVVFFFGVSSAGF
jgi:hypothetical protein